jgi:hypothetical protein
MALRGRTLKRKVYLSFGRGATEKGGCFEHGQSGGHNDRRVLEAIEARGGEKADEDHGDCTEAHN